MAIQDRVRKLTYDDYILIPEDRKRHEIIDGEHYVSPAPRYWHQRLVGKLFYLLYGFVLREGLGEVGLSPTDIVFSQFDVVQPDLFYISKERAGIITEDNIQGSPDLVIEVLSKKTRGLDEGIKLWRYERFGVKEYWLVDRFRKTVTVFRWVDGAFLQKEVLSAAAGDVLTTPLLTGLEIPLAELFAG